MEISSSLFAGELFKTNSFPRIPALHQKGSDAFSRGGMGEIISKTTELVTACKYIRYVLSGEISSGLDAAERVKVSEYLNMLELNSECGIKRGAEIAGFLSRLASGGMDEDEITITELGCFRDFNTCLQGMIDALSSLRKEIPSQASGIVSKINEKLSSLRADQTEFLNLRNDFFKKCLFSELFINSGHMAYETKDFFRILLKLDDEKVKAALNKYKNSNAYPNVRKAIEWAMRPEVEPNIYEPAHYP